MPAEPQEIQNVIPLQPRDVPPSAADGMARLAALHDEAEETAVLANLLGRTPYAAAMLATLALVTIAIAGIGVSLAETVAWCVFMLAAVAAFVRVYAHGIRAPFERAALKSFHEDAKAISLYAGFAWGAGAFLSLPAMTSAWMLVVFAGGASAVMALLLKNRSTVLCFTAPAIVLSAAAASLRPLAAGATGLAGVLLAGIAVMVVAYLADRIGRRSRAVPALADLPLS